MQDQRCSRASRHHCRATATAHPPAPSHPPAPCAMGRASRRHAAEESASSPRQMGNEKRPQTHLVTHPFTRRTTSAGADAQLNVAWQLARNHATCVASYCNMHPRRASPNEQNIARIIERAWTTGTHIARITEPLTPITPGSLEFGDLLKFVYLWSISGSSSISGVAWTELDQHS